MAWFGLLVTHRLLGNSTLIDSPSKTVCNGVGAVSQGIIKVLQSEGGRDVEQKPSLPSLKPWAPLPSYLTGPLAHLSCLRLFKLCAAKSLSWASMFFHQKYIRHLSPVSVDSLKPIAEAPT